MAPPECAAAAQARSIQIALNVNSARVDVCERYETHVIITTKRNHLLCKEQWYVCVCRV